MCKYRGRNNGQVSTRVNNFTLAISEKTANGIIKITSILVFFKMQNFKLASTQIISMLLLNKQYYIDLSGTMFKRTKKAAAGGTEMYSIHLSDGCKDKSISGSQTINNYLLNSGLGISLQPSLIIYILCNRNVSKECGVINVLWTIYE